MKITGNIWRCLIKWIEENKEWLNIILTVAAIIVAWCLLNETHRQVDETHAQVIEARKQDSITLYALNYQRNRDSANDVELRKKDFINWEIQNKSLNFAKRGIDLAESSAGINQEISRTAIQPFVFADYPEDIKDAQVGRRPSADFNVINVGATAGYNFQVQNMIIWESNFSDKIMDSVNIDTVAFFLGKDKPKRFTSWFYFKDSRWSIGDSNYYIGGAPLLLICKIFYDDAFGRTHFTQQGFTMTKANPHWTEIRKYTKTDYVKKKNHHNK